MKVVDLKQAAWDTVGSAALWSVYLVVLAIDAAARAGGWVVTKLQRPAERREVGER